MGKLFTEITDKQADFIEKQKMFFVGTAAEEGSVNISPKGMDYFRILNNNNVAWMNLTGSGNESSAHVQINPRMTIMFCAFEGSPLILRLYGKAKVIHQNDEEWDKLASLFPESSSSRQVFILEVENTQSSCGKGVPLYDYNSDREDLLVSAKRKGKEGIQAYWKQANQNSLDGFPTNILKLSGVNEA